MGKYQVVHRMERVIGANAKRGLLKFTLGGKVGGAVALHHFWPQADPAEDVRGHVQGVWRRGRDLGIDAGSRQATLGQFGIVICVDQVVSDTWMIGVFLEERLQDGDRKSVV